MDPKDKRRNREFIRRGRHSECHKSAKVKLADVVSEHVIEHRRIVRFQLEIDIHKYIIVVYHDAE
ncbi:hypothetical protein NQ315_014176 [Exocentrus adspersus]|uniref:Uncharacterized protein n=1 Tax=Exocentrus adspersus TaxID=1586481 RepID=A0AAV8VWM5_9CUCU|nr:hypothetical protein NQ315_014176 [Exocentrus adspersus]